MHKYESIVVKVEFVTLTDEFGTLDPIRLERMAMILSNLSNSGKHLLLIISGAIPLGALRLNMGKIPKDLISQQTAAAVGQAELIRIYQSYFEEYNQRVAQILLTNDVICHEERKRNTLNTFNTLFEMNIIPLINENDVVSTEDIEYMDNYPLTYNVAMMSGSNLIIIRGEKEGDYSILLRGQEVAHKVPHEEDLITEVEKRLKELKGIDSENLSFPKSIKELKYI